jgi:two-component system CheB/CheR fusion protein
MGTPATIRRSSIAAEPLRILLVDDHEDCVRPLASLLRREGHVVATAHSVAAALALASQQPPIDALISDIGLPDGDGCNLLDQLRDFYGGRDVPAIAISGYDDEYLMDACRRAGYRTFLVKPVMFEQVLEALGALLAASGPAR